MTGTPPSRGRLQASYGPPVTDPLRLDLSDFGTPVRVRIGDPVFTGLEGAFPGVLGGVLRVDPAGRCVRPAGIGENSSDLIYRP